MQFQMDRVDKLVALLGKRVDDRRRTSATSGSNRWEEEKEGKTEDWSTHGIVIVLLIFLTCQTNCDICYNMDNNQWYQRNSKWRVKVGPVCNQFAVNKWREQWQCCRVGRTEKRSKRAFLGSFPLLKHSLYYELPSCMISTFPFKFDVHFSIPLDCPRETLEAVINILLCVGFHL